MYLPKMPSKTFPVFSVEEVMKVRLRRLWLNMGGVGNTLCKQLLQERDGFVPILARQLPNWGCRSHVTQLFDWQPAQTVVYTYNNHSRRAST